MPALARQERRRAVGVGLQRIETSDFEGAEGMIRPRPDPAVPKVLNLRHRGPQGKMEDF